METRESITQGSNQEEWREIPGHEGYYEVSSHGRVRSVDRVIVGANGVRQRFKGRIRKPATDKKGYRTVNLRRGGKGKTSFVHRLVLSAFVGPCPPGQESRHLNGVPGDNRLCNLAYGTRSENRRDRRVHGTDHNLNKSHCPRGHNHFGENNAKSAARRGKRDCLICGRARTYLRDNPDFPESMKWAVYDYQLERLLLDLESAEKV